MRILVVDDIATNRRLLGAILETAGYGVEFAADGEDALASLDRASFGAVISDVLMPRMDGFRLCYEIRRDPRHATIPFLFMTATYTSPGDRKLAEAIGADRMLQKPVEAAELLAALEDVLADPRMREPRKILAPSELDVIKEYSDSLVAKLEEKNTELQQRAEDLKKLSSALEQTADTILITDKEGRIEYVNPSFERTTGYSLAEVRGKTPAILKSGEHEPSFYEGLWRTILAGRVFRGEFVNRRRSGELYYEHQTISPVLDDGGAIVSFVSAGKDVTERKRAEEQLRLAHRQMRDLLEHSPAMIYTMRPDGERSMLTAVTENISRLLGMASAEATRRSWWAAQLHPADKARVLRSLGETLERGGLTLEYRLQHKDGRYLWVQDSRRVIHGEEGQVPEIAGVWTDITERKRVDEIQRESDRRLREMLENLELIAVTLSTSGAVTFCNDYLLDLTGWKREDVLLGDWFSLFVPSGHGRVREDFFRHVKAGTIPHHDQHPIVTRGGEPREILWNNTLLRDASGAVVGTASIGEDITDRKRAEEALLESTERFRQLTESIHEVFWLTDPLKGTMLYVSPAYETVWGTSRQSLLETPAAWLEAIHPDDRARVKAAVREKQAAGTYDEVFRIVRPDGSVRWVHDKAFPVRDSAGVVYRLAGVAEDITERMRVEHALRDSEEQFRLIAENVADLIALHDIDGRRLYNSPSYAALFGDPRELVGSDPFVEIHPDDRDRVREIFEDTVKTGVGHRAEFRLLARDGTVHMIESQGSAIRGEHGEVKRVIVVSRDVTEKKKLELQFLRAQRMESIGVLAGGIAHDLNNVLSPILMAVDILKRRFSDPQSQKLLQTLETSALRGSGMVKQVLTFARGLGGEREAIQIGHLVVEMERIIRETFPRSIRLRTDVPKDLWTISGDVTQLHQVLLNLAVNARDAMPDGGDLRIALENLMVDESYAGMQKELGVGPHVVMNVEDTGTGMPPDVVGRIFEPFYTTKEVGRGTGLGLSTVQGIVKSHGGVIKVYSEPGRGTTFRVYLPAYHAAVEAVEEGRPAGALVGHGELILVIDDEASIRDITRVTLESFGYEVVTASDGADALTRYLERKDAIRIVITDMMMPVMDGHATIRVLLRMNPTLRIIATSGLLAEEKALEYSQLKVRAFLTKPYTARTLLRTVARVLTDGEAPAS